MHPIHEDKLLANQGVHVPGNVVTSLLAGGLTLTHGAKGEIPALDDECPIKGLHEATVILEHNVLMRDDINLIHRQIAATRYLWITLIQSLPHVWPDA